MANDHPIVFWGDSLIVFSAMVDPGRLRRNNGYNAFRAWLLAKYLDRKGCGECTLSVLEWCELLDCGKKTLQRYVANKQFFSCYRYLNGCLTVWMHSKKSVFKSLRLRDPGVAFEIDKSDLSSTDRLLKMARVAVQQAAQNRTRYATERQKSSYSGTRDGSGKMMLAFSTLKRNLCYKCLRGKRLLGRKGNRVYVQNLSTWGVSQQFVAKQCKRSKSTIQRAVSNLKPYSLKEMAARRKENPKARQRSSRITAGLPKLDKFQFCESRPEYFEAYDKQQFILADPLTPGTKGTQHFLMPVEQSDGTIKAQAFKAVNNVIDSDVVLRRASWQRRKLIAAAREAWGMA